MGVDGEVTLHGTHICATSDDLARVTAGVLRHIALTRAEAGCLAFDVVQTANPMIWAVSERFVDAAAFEAHQTRTAASDWAQLTAGIARDYKVAGLA